MIQFTKIPFEWYDLMKGLSEPLLRPAHGRCLDHDRGTPVTVTKNINTNADILEFV